MRRDIDDALRGWPFDPVPGEVSAREVKARDGRYVLQIRLDLGLLQMETTGRPDGLRPHGFASILDFLRHRAAGRPRRAEPSDPWVMTADHGAEADRELLQYNQRRIAWLALHRYDRALADADHALALLDFVRRHGPTDDAIAAFDRNRGFVLFQRAQAAAALALERHRPEDAVDAVRDGAVRLGEHQRDWEAEHDEPIPDAELAEQLERLEQEIRRSFSVRRTLQEQLDEAVAREDYERAALLRDQIRSRGHAGR